MATGNVKLRYHCVEVVAGPDGCAAAKALKGQRLLSADAPRLPLATCDQPANCACRYLHHDDRRAGPRRDADQGKLPSPWSYTERRERRGRRDSDFE
jgi:hypothetical protein